MTQLHKIYLDLPKIPADQVASSTELRCTFTDILINFLQKNNHTVITKAQKNINPEIFFNTLKTHPKVYQASMSRQVAVDLPPDIEETALKNEPKDWYLKTADYGDECDRILQHRDGEFTQFLEHLAFYHQKFQEGYEKVVLIYPPAYTGYDVQLTAAMQCLGYTPEQFQCISVQPLKLFAFHKPTQKICAIPNLPLEELLKAVSMNALRWYSLRVPLTSIAPIDITIAGQYHPKNSLYRVQFAYLRCCKILQEWSEPSLLDNPTIDVTSYLEKSGKSPESKALAKTLKATPEIIQQSANEVAPHLVIRHLETISDRCHLWLDNFTRTPENKDLLLATQYILFDLMVNLLEIKVHKM